MSDRPPGVYPRRGGGVVVVKPDPPEPHSAPKTAGLPLTQEEHLRITEVLASWRRSIDHPENTTPIEIHSADVALLERLAAGYQPGYRLVAEATARTLVHSLGYIERQLRYIRERHPDDPAWSAVFNDFSWHVNPALASSLSPKEEDKPHE